MPLPRKYGRLEQGRDQGNDALNDTPIHNRCHREDRTRRRAAQSRPHQPKPNGREEGQNFPQISQTLESLEQIGGGGAARAHVHLPHRPPASRWTSPSSPCCAAPSSSSSGLASPPPLLCFLQCELTMDERVLSVAPTGAKMS